jgi:plastocyanin
VTDRTRIVLLAAAALGALAAPAAGLAQTQERLIATVGTNDAHVITLTRENGSPVADIPAGTYTIEVRDRSRMHNFRLSGPGVERRTDVEDIRTETWIVTLRDQSVYTFLCESHPAEMRDTFTTGGGPPEPPQPPPPSVGTTVYATVGPGFRISFHTRRGTRIRRLRAGRYRVVVRDRSRTHSFQIYGRGVNKRTRIAFAGTTTWSLTFRRGYRYRYRCNAHPGRMRGSFRT